MKKLLLFMLVLMGGVGQVWASTGHVLHLVSNLSSPEWSDSDDSNTYLFEYSSDGTQEIYEYTVTSAMIGDKDFYFRVNFWDEWGQLRPPLEGNKEYSYESNGKWETSDTWSGSNNAFMIRHTSIKASAYKITVYRKLGEGAWIKTEIVSMPVEIKSVGAATFSCNRALDFSSLSSSFTAKTITGVSGVTLTKSDALTTVPANTGLYLEGTAGTYDVPVIETGDASAVGTNLLIAQSTAGSVSQTVGEGASKKTNYILTNKTVGGPADLKFYKVYASGNTVGAGKAYLQIDTPEGGGLAREYLWFDETTTGVSEQVAAKSGNAGAVYNLSGQRVAQPTRGLYIVNGKKYIVK